MSLYGPLAKLEEERRRRKTEDLNRRFDATLRHMDALVGVNEEAYKAKKAVFAAAKRSEPPVKAPSPAKPVVTPSKKSKARGKKRSR
jgi:hypothetical protein